jgi:hypothetical protein
VNQDGPLAGSGPRDDLALAVHCLYLRRTLESGRLDPIVMLCQHPVREGKDCIGPFLEDLTTSCRLWEPHPQSHLIPLPEPERWQRRRRRQSYDASPSPGSSFP